MRVFLIALMFAATASAQEIAKLPEAWNRPVEPFRVAGNVFYVGSSEMAAFLITTPKGHILLDSGAEETVPLILQSIGKLGYRAEDVDILISSHAHFDHNGGMATLRKLTGAKLYLSREDAPLAARGGLRDPMFGDRFYFRPFRPDRYIADRVPLRLGPVSVTPLMTRGHTPGCTSWMTTVEEGARTLDVIFVCSVTAPDYRLVNNPAYPNVIEDYRATFATLRALKPDVFLGAHASFFNMKEKLERRARGEANPFIDPEGYRRHIERAAERFETMVKEQQAAAK
jgi:metallo-beta-lactamase class B